MALHVVFGGMIEISGEIALKKGKDHSIRRKHPWIFSGAIQSQKNSFADGSWVTLIAYDGHVLGHGHYQAGSIAVRVLSFETEKPDELFWTKKIHAAMQLRRATGLPNQNTNAYRLIHGEGDGLPGLIVDIYGDTAVIQAHSIGMHLDRQYISLALQEVLAEKLKCIYYKSHGTLPGVNAIETQEYLYGKSALPGSVKEYGNQFLVDWEHGQKTGFFIDQRENRKMLSDCATGRTVLNTFCYTGGFSVYAIQGGAETVHSVDSSEKAIDLTRKNIELNGHSAEKHNCYVSDVFEFMKGKHNVYDCIVLDPPAFAKHRDARHQAVKGYQRLNAEALRIIKPGGLLFTFSCSQVVDRKLFYDTVVSAAIQVGRSVKVLSFLGQPADHPVSIYHPEGEYLKGLLLFVE